MVIHPTLAVSIDERTIRLTDPTLAMVAIRRLVEYVRGDSTRDLLFRGQSNSSWKVHSKFARRDDIKALVLTPEGTYEAYEHLGQMLSACVPSEELLALEQRHPGIDAHFELHRHIRQYPEKPEYDDASNIAVEWLLDWRKALAFLCEDPASEGCLFVLDHQALGSIFMAQGLDKVHQAILDTVANGRLPRRPYIVHPPQQPHAPARIDKQQPVLMIQADITVGLEDAFETLERESAVGVVSYRKVLVPGAMKPQIQALLAAEGISVDWLMDRPVPPVPDADTATTPHDA